MCDLDHSLRLCTCADDVPHPDWTLHRRDEALPLQHLRGMAARPFFSADDEHLCQLLNANPGCFDFDYTPRIDDRLVFERPRRVALRFTDDGWALDRSTALDAWQSQLVPLHQGRLG